MEKPDFLWQYIPAYGRIFEDGSHRGYELCGPGDEVRLLLAVSAVKEQGKTVLYITETDDQAKKIWNGARRFLSFGETGFYPARDLLPYESMAANDSQNAGRVHVLEGLSSGKPFLAVVSKNTMARRVIPPDVWQSVSLTLSAGDVIEIAELSRRLTDMGYVRDTLTEERGCFSVRGSIIDVFPPSRQQQVRVQLSMVLQAVVSQQLLPGTDGKPVPAFEIMLVNPAIRNLIREGKTHQINNVIFANPDTMTTMDASILNLYHEGKIAASDAIIYSTDAETMRKKVKG